MALTNTEIEQIAMIIGKPASLIRSVVSALGTDLTAEKETLIRAELAKWSGGTGSVFTRFTPTESNRGLNLNAGDAKSDVRSNLRTLLEITGGSCSGIGTIEVGT